MKSHTTSLMVCFLVLALPVITCAQVETVFNEVHFNEPLKIVHEKVKEISETTQVIVVDKTSFPLARDKEEHLICTDVKTKEGIVSKIVFTFADDKLASIEAKGNAVESLINSRKDTAVNYLHYKVFPSELLIGDPQEDRVWMLTKESGHLHLFTWNNPYLGSKRPVPEYEPSAKIPDILKMGGHIDELTPVLRRGSMFMNIEALDGSDPNAQTQINCFGVEYAGFPRKLEARFGDKKLNTVWILTAKAEEDRIRKKLTEEYGKALFINDNWEVFNDWQVLLRKDKPEVLLLTRELGVVYKKELGEKH
jgi:hypothetical protein